jgi:hypothetical protein
VPPLGLRGVTGEGGDDKGGVDGEVIMTLVYEKAGCSCIVEKGRVDKFRRGDNS